MSSRARKADSEADFLTHIILHRSAKQPPIFHPTARSKLDIVVTRLLRLITHIAEIVVKNLTISYASSKPRVTYGDSQVTSNGERGRDYSSRTLTPVKGSALRMPWPYPRSQ